MKTAKAKSTRKVSSPRRYKIGLSATPMGNFDECKKYFFEEIDKSTISEIIKTWIKKTYKKEEAQIIFTHEEYHFQMYTYFAATIHWINNGKELDEKNKGYLDALHNYYTNLLNSGSKKKEEVKKKISKSTVDEKLTSQIMYDLDNLEDQWIENKETTIDLYIQMQKHQIKPSLISSIKTRLEGWLLEYEDAYYKRCDQAVEAYSHLSKKEIKRRIDSIQQMLSDVDKFKSALNTKKMIRSIKNKTPDKQVLNFKFLKSSEKFKIVSINPILIPESFRFYSFNEKTRILSEFVSLDKKGLSIKGNTIFNYDSENSRSIKLRNPEQFLQIIMNKSLKEIEGEWKNLTTKSYSLTSGRINKDTLLLRVYDK